MQSVSHSRCSTHAKASHSATLRARNHSLANIGNVFLNMYTSSKGVEDSLNLPSTQGLLSNKALREGEFAQYPHTCCCTSPASQHILVWPGGCPRQSRAKDLFEQGSLHYTPDHCLCRWWCPFILVEKNHDSNGQTHLLRSPVEVALSSPSSMSPSQPLAIHQTGGLPKITSTRSDAIRCDPRPHSLEGNEQAAAGLWPHLRLAPSELRLSGKATGRSFRRAVQANSAPTSIHTTNPVFMISTSQCRLRWDLQLFLNACNSF